MARGLCAPVAVALAALLCGPVVAHAQRRGGGGARTSVNRSGSVNVNRNANINRNTNVNRNVDVNRNYNVNRNVNVDVEEAGEAAAITAASEWPRRWRRPLPSRPLSSARESRPFRPVARPSWRAGSRISSAAACGISRSLSGRERPTSS